MNLSAKIHDAWTNNAALNAALPGTRLFTGRVPAGTTKPFARVSFPGSARGKRSDKATDRQTQIRFQHWAEENAFGAGEDIQTKIEAAFDNYDVALDDSQVVNIRHDNSFYVQEDSPTGKLWQFVSQFTATIQKDRTL